jgi:hypothetical protein
LFEEYLTYVAPCILLSKGPASSNRGFEGWGEARYFAALMLALDLKPWPYAVMPKASQEQEAVSVQGSLQASGLVSAYLAAVHGYHREVKP